jgi:hypothetical protein
MTNKQIIIDVCPYQGECSVSGCKRNDDGCFVRQLFEERDRAENQIVELNKTIKAKEQEYEELRKYHNKCCEEFEKEKKEWLEKYNQVSRDFYNGDYCNTEHCSLLRAKEQECEELKEEVKKYGEINEQETKDYAELKAENDELKELIAQDQCFQDKSHKCVKSFYIDERYKQSIEKIKEIAEKEVNNRMLFADKESFCDFNKILQKISEVENEN